MSDFYLEIQDREFDDIAPDPGLTFTVEEAEFGALGGPISAKMNVTGPERGIWDLLDWLRYDVVIRTGLAERFWWGYVQAVEVKVGDRTLRMGLESMFNRVKISYSFVPTGSTTMVDRRETSWDGDTDSINEYGYKEVVVRMDSATSFTAAVRQDSLLEQKKYPQGEFDANFGAASSAPAEATLTLAGWWQTLDWRIASTLDVNGIDNSVWGGTKNVRVGHSDSEKVCMQFTTDADAGAVREITICAGNAQSPTDSLKVEIFALDGSGHPTGTALGSATKAASSLQSVSLINGPDYDDIITFQLSSSISLSASTQYGLVVSRSSSLDDTNKYRLAVDKTLAYASNAAFVYTTAEGWRDIETVYGTDVDIPFILWMDVEMGAGRLINGLVTEYGEFITDTKWWDNATTEVSSYLAGTRSLLDELVPILESAGANSRRMLSWVDWERVMHFSEEPARSTIEHYLDLEGRILDGNQQPVGLGELHQVVGTYAQIIDLIPENVSLERMIEINLHFIEGIKWTRSGGVKPLFRGQKSLRDIVNAPMREPIPDGTEDWIDRTGMFDLMDDAYEVSLDAEDGRLYGGAGVVVVDNNGITITSPETTPANASAYKFTNGSDIICGVYSFRSASDNYIDLAVNKIAGDGAQVRIMADGDSPQLAVIKLTADDDIDTAEIELKVDSGDSEINLTADNINITGDITLTGDLNRNSALFPQFIPKASFLNNTDYNGDSFSTNTSKVQLDLHTGWSVPDDVVAVLVNVIARDSGSAGGTANVQFFASSTAGNPSATLKLDGLANDEKMQQNVIIPCTNGDIWWSRTATGTNTLDVWIWIIGYWR